MKKLLGIFLALAFVFLCANDFSVSASVGDEIPLTVADASVVQGTPVSGFANMEYALNGYKQSSVQYFGLNKGTGGFNGDTSVLSAVQFDLGSVQAIRQYMVAHIPYTMTLPDANQTTFFKFANQSWKVYTSLDGVNWTLTDTVTDCSLLASDYIQKKTSETTSNGGDPNWDDNSTAGIIRYSKVDVPGASYYGLVKVELNKAVSARYVVLAFTSGYGPERSAFSYRGYTISGMRSIDGAAATATVFAGFALFGPYTGVAFRGVQESEVMDGKYNIRLVATVDSLTYDEIGFKVTAKYTEGGVPVERDLSVACTKVYKKLTGKTATGIAEYTAEDLGGNFLMALGINNIPASLGEIVFEVTPYTVLNEAYSFGETYTITYDSGVLVGQN